MKLTHKNYFTPKNHYLTNSKIQLFLKDKHRFKDYYINNNVVNLITDPIIIGSAVDLLASKGMRSFKRTYKLVDRRSAKDPKYVTQLNQSMYDTVIGLWESLSSQDAYNDLEDYDRQVLLSEDIDIGNSFVGIAGILDFLKIEDDRAYIVDLKTSSSTKPETYAFKCLDYGYDMQMAMYSRLVRTNYPQVKTIVCRHLTIDKDSDGIYKVYTFRFSDETMEYAEFKMTDAIEQISIEKEFAPSNASWDEETLI